MPSFDKGAILVTGASGRDIESLDKLAAETGCRTLPLGRWATEDDIAGPIVFLLSDRAAMITGVSLPIDGGFTAC